MATIVASNRECACEAVQMLARMSTLIGNWFDNPKRFEPGLGRLMDEMFTHLETQLDEPKNSRVKKEYGELLGKIDEAVNNSRVGMTSNMAGVDRIRDSIHRFPAIRQAFLCEPPGKETQLSTEVSIPMHILGEGKVEDPTGDARKELDRIYRELECSVSKEEGSNG